MSILPSVAYNLQNHGTDYNLLTSGDDLSAGSSRVYAWQATSCGSEGVVYLVDTLAQKCLWGNGVHDCVSTDQAWSIREDDSVDTYIIQNVNEGENGFLSLYEDKSFNLSGGTSSYSQWSFQSETPPTSVTWDVCDHIDKLIISSSSTGASSSSSSTSASSSSSSMASTQAVTVTVSSSSGASGTESSGSSATPDSVSKTSTSSGEQFSAAMTAAATGESSNSVASEVSMSSATSQTPSRSSLPQSNNAVPRNAAWCFLLAALMVSVSVTSS
ncbi:uncharacterized protein M421DRAFT_416547 [Didymella exigua CBS 183.55]|uniref:Uncharacterized protein n=1 Tax=Didymella exigua CBS 183.55 TaxID=1150837 RepID=A0A6A5RX20_9PLEO|nr:uncharacterized protein M421DRAFT_416547 [Didymella exigua CBS 183.55]KAF1932951.1 hypothetical protein M421DRAFT_416547 [Didymella exigua CBS 183.55]